MSEPVRAQIGSVLDHPVPTDDELLELLFIGLWRALPDQQTQGKRVTPTSLGHMANGIFTALVRAGVMTDGYRESLATRLEFVMRVHGHCTVVRSDKSLRLSQIREHAASVKTHLFTQLNETEMYAHSLLVASKGYRLFLTNTGQAYAKTLVPKYPGLTQELFEFGWKDYTRRVRSSDMVNYVRRGSAAAGDNSE
jgi:hypothetical protein